MQKELLMIAAAVVVGALVVNKFPAAVPLNFRSVRGVASLEATPPSSPEPVHKGRTEAKSAAEKPRASRLVDSPANQMTVFTEPVPFPPAVGAPDCCPAPALPFPTPEILKPGAAAADIVKRFGPPSFDVAGTRDGRVLETYYYVSHDRSRMTVMNLQNGLLAGIDSRSSPYFQLRGMK